LTPSGCVSTKRRKITVAGNIKVAVNNDPEYINNAEIIGTDVAGLEEFLSREATFLTGEMWGARDRRNTQDKDWKAQTLTWAQWIEGQPGNKNAPAWGFSRHPVGKHKEGSCIVLGSSVDGARKAKAMDTMYAMGLDVDSGASLDETLDRVEELGLLCFAYTTFSHGKTGLELKRDEVLRKLSITRDPTIEEVQTFLRDHDKHRYEESFIAGCTIEKQKHQTSEGVKIVLDTPPLDKFRLIFPLAEPVKLIDLADTQQASLDLWEDKITGLARNTLGVHFDVSCTDVSRLFYTARHPKGSDDWYAAIIMGNPLSFDDVKPMRKAAYTGGKDQNAFTMAGGDEDRPPECTAPSGMSLNGWHFQKNGAKDRFLIADLLETLCADKIRTAGGEAQGHVHTECPFEHEHSEEGGTATMAINCIDADPRPSGESYWTWFCHHDACQGRHKLQFLEEALRQGWFEEDSLYDLDQGFLLPVGDDEVDPFEAQEVKEERAATFEERAAEFDGKTAADAEKFIAEVYAAGVEDAAIRERINKNIKNKLGLPVKTVRDMWAALDKAKEQKAKEKKKKKGKIEGILTTAPAPDQTEYVRESVKVANEKDPFLFEYMEEATIVRRGRVVTLDRKGKRHQLGKVTVFHRPKGEDAFQHVFAPYDVVDDLFSSDLSDFCLPLRGTVDTPFFAADGTLVMENGYHAGSQMYLDSGVDIDRVSGVPTAEEVDAAKRLIVENLLADFPLDGLTRPEIMKALDGEPIPAVTHAVALTLLPFMREIIDGPTPGWVLSKPAPGTGASLLVKLLTTVASGVPAPESSLPSNKEEIPKTLTALLMNGPTHIVFDNVNHSMDSGELASAQTSRTYQARVLGKSQTVEVDVRSVFIFTANNASLAAELLRRSIFIPLDAKVEAPEKRTGFMHEDVFKWVDQNRARLVHACLTLIQNWVAQGMQRSAYNLASFEDWAKVTGGVLDAAGFAGFLEGQEDAKAMAADAAQDSIDQLMDVLSDYPDDTLFRPGGKAKFNDEVTVNLVDILNGAERAFTEPGNDQLDPIQINGWGYSDFDGCYKTAGRIRPGFDKLARKPRRGRASDDREYILHFEAIQDTKNKGAVFRMTKEVA
jgi:hypothetical protein